MWLRLKMMAEVSTCCPAFHPLHPQKEELASLVHRLVQSLTFWNLTFAPIRLQIVDQIWCHCCCIYILTFPETAQDACIHILYVMLTVYACSANLLAWNYIHNSKWCLCKTTGWNIAKYRSYTKVVYKRSQPIFLWVEGLSCWTSHPRVSSVAEYKVGHSETLLLYKTGMTPWLPWRQILWHGL